jgi:hydrogenase/urease accessory protein HupE
MYQLFKTDYHMFGTYLELGFDHISDLNGYDHILFIVALCAAYSIAQWRQLIILVTAFTIGHCITLALASLGIVKVPGLLIEVLIPVTIMLTAVQNLLNRKNTTRSWQSLYLVPLLFGLIHGLGFSNYFRSLFEPNDSIVLPLLAFNIGVELGQLGIVAVFLLITYVVVKLFKVPERIWQIIVSGIAIALSAVMIIQRVMEV